MNNKVPENGSASKVWNPLYIGIISFFCFILPAIILMGINYEKLGRPDLKLKTWILGSAVFVILISLFIFLPDDYTWLVNALHIITAVGIAAIQYPLFFKARERNPELKIDSLIKPAFYSLGFALLIAILMLAGNEILFRQQIKSLELSKEFFNKKQYNQAINELKKVHHDYPSERLPYINMAIAYQEMGKPDSAKITLQQWLKIAPDDSEAKELLSAINSRN